MQIEFAPFQQFLEFMSPLSSERAAKLVRFASTHASGTVVDIGCGWAALLTRLLEANASIHGLGLDLNDNGFAHAIQIAKARGVADRLELVSGDAKSNLPVSAHGAICIGASQVWKKSADRDGPLEYVEALSALRSLVITGSPVIYGEAIWSTEPTFAAAAPLAGRLDEFISIPELLEIAWNSGFSIVEAHEANQDEWDHFESGYTARYAVWLANNPQDHPQYKEILKKALHQRDAYFRGYRGVLGMAYLCMLAV